MRTFWFCCWLLVAASSAHAADAGTVTVAEGSARLLRGAMWQKLAEGARLQEGDLIDAADRAQVQVEAPDGAILNLVGPAMLYAAAIASRERGAEWFLRNGYLKLVARPGNDGLRLRTRLITAIAADTTLVVHDADTVDEIFVESGSARLAENGKNEDLPSTANAGEFWLRATDKPLASLPHATAFIAALPRHFVDPLPRRADHFRDVKVALAPDREISFSEARPWLDGPYRKSFVRRLSSRLKDKEFRREVLPVVATYPEWDRRLHPEKFAPKVNVQPQGAPSAPGNGSRK